MSSILVDWEIKKMIKDGLIVISPFDESLINSNSVDFRLGNHYMQMNPTGVAVLGGTQEPIIDPLHKDSFTSTSFVAGTYFLKPKEFILVSMLEDITIPINVCAELRGKSSIGRLGIMQSSVAGFTDSNWSGNLVMELFNYSDNTIKLTKGMKIGQMLFHRTNTPDKGYDKTGRYYKQKPGEQGSLGV